MWHSIFNTQNRWITGVSVFLMLVANSSFASQLLLAYPLSEGNLWFVS
jgi:hypothetical protein